MRGRVLQYVMGKTILSSLYCGARPCISTRPKAVRCGVFISGRVARLLKNCSIEGTTDGLLLQAYLSRAHAHARARARVVAHTQGL
jgi:hypothetical protein